MGEDMRRDPNEDFDYPALPEGHPLRRHLPARFGLIFLDDRIDVRGQTAFACDLYRAVAEHFNGISALAGLVPEYRNDRSFGVVAERLIDLVANCKFRGHGESFRIQALRAARPKYGFVAIGKTGKAGLHIRPCRYRSHRVCVSRGTSRFSELHW